ncbi:hypothetical protein MKQ70_25360 [Chitinophaga sedimenti]|nr:hypothetical protein [Chitinophaga sedimenti]
MGLRKGSVVTEALKQNAVTQIHNYYADKGFRNVVTRVEEQNDPRQQNSAKVLFYVSKGGKVRVNSINFVGNYNLADNKLKKKMKGTKEMSRLTLHPDDKTVYVDSVKEKSDYWKEMGFLSATRTPEALDPYFRFHVFANSKFNDGKYFEDKEKLIAYYNAQGYRDAVIVRDTTYPSYRNNLNIDIEVEEGKNTTSVTLAGKVIPCTATPFWHASSQSKKATYITRNCSKNASVNK